VKAQLTILADQVTGPIGNLVAAPTNDPNVINITKRKRRTGKSHENKSCKAFALADTLYHNMTDSERWLWRTACTIPKKSGYDLWMMHAIANIAAGYLPPAIPPTPAGWTHGLAPPGPYWIDSPYVKMRPNQTCHGTVAWTYAYRMYDQIDYTISLDLRHHDDDEPFNVTLSYWLLWHDDTTSWQATTVNESVDANAQLEFTLPAPPPYYPLTNTGVIEISYGNLRQRFVIKPDQILHIPLHPCSADTPQLCSAIPPRPVVAAAKQPYWWPRDTLVGFVSRTANHRSRKLGYYNQASLELQIADDSGSTADAANVHVVGHRLQSGPGSLWNVHTTFGRFRPRTLHGPVPPDYCPTGRTIIVHAGCLFSLKWEDNRYLAFAIDTPAFSQNKP